MKTHFSGDAVLLSFDVLLDGKASKVNSGVVNVYGPDAKLLVTHTTKEQRNHVTYIVPGGNNQKVGEYTAIFTVSVDGYGQTSHVVKYKVKPLPVSKKIARQVQNVTE